MRAVDTVEAEVRELVRRRGLDPNEDRAAVRRLVDEVISDYDDRALTSSPAPLTDTQTAARTVFDAVAGFGPLQRHLDDPEIEEIWINERPTGCDWRPSLVQVITRRMAVLAELDAPRFTAPPSC